MLKHVKPILVQVHYTLVDRVHSWQLPCHHLRMVELASGAFPRPTQASSSSTELFSVRGDISPGESGPSLSVLWRQPEWHQSKSCMHDIVQTWTEKQTHVQPFLFHPWIERLKVSTKPFEGDLRKKNNKKTKNNYCVVYRKANPNKSPTQDEASLWAMPRSSDGSGSAGFEGTSWSKGASSTSSSRGSRGLFSESCDLPPGESSGLSWRLKSVNLQRQCNPTL